MVNFDQLTTTAADNQVAGAGPAAAAGPGAPAAQQQNGNHHRTQNGHCGPRMLSLNRREELIFRYMNITRLRREYAVRCLEENNFNIRVALDVFNQLKEANALPDDIFVS